MRTVEVIWQGRPVDAADPDPIGQFVPTLSEAVVRRTEQAAAAVQRVGDRATGPLEVAARLLLRTEGLASSAIEGLRAPAADVAIAELTAGSDHGNQGSYGTAARVADNLAVVYDALSTPAPMKAQVMLAWHRRLMTHASGIEAVHIGAWQDHLGWVGGFTPLTSAHVAAPADRIPALIDDLCHFVARDDVDPVTQAAIADAQFETIHPFADGNGRIGRVLIGWILAARLRLSVPPGFQCVRTRHRRVPVRARPVPPRDHPTVGVVVRRRHQRQHHSDRQRLRHGRRPPLRLEQRHERPAS